METPDFMARAAVILCCAAVRYAATVAAAKASHNASAGAKKKLRVKLYKKITRLGPAYYERVSTGEVIQVAVEGIDQLETYFGRYLPQFFYAIIAPLILPDEPASNLDTLNEGRILMTLDAVRDEKSIVLVSHRRSVKAMADRSYAVR